MNVSAGASRSAFSVATLFNRQWWWTTLLVLAAMAVMVRLGFWQLDRLAQRRARNAEIVQQLSLPPLLLSGEALPDAPARLKDRRATARGRFDFSHQVALKLQNWQNRPGIHLVAPLVIDGGDKAVLVDRGWLPEAEAAAENWSKFDEPGPVEVSGFIQLSQTLPPGREGAGVAQLKPGPQLAWYRLDIEAIQAQMPYELLPVYLLQSPGAGDNAALPYRLEPDFDLSEGPHLGYAIQWYLFALILAAGYVRYVRKTFSKA
ncbi:MAG: SURF1 family protein [Anaerolineae bacterium]